MSKEGNRFMWLMVFFDLPVKERKERRHATRFRNFLLNDGYIMLQFSVYARLCNGQERVEKHLDRLQKSLPGKGSVRALQITDRQYKRMKRLLGKEEKNTAADPNQAGSQLFLF